MLLGPPGGAGQPVPPVSFQRRSVLRWTGGRRRGAGATAALLLTLLAVPATARAVEYRLQVVSIYGEAFRSLLRPNELCSFVSTEITAWPAAWN